MITQRLFFYKDFFIQAWTVRVGQCVFDVFVCLNVERGSLQKKEDLKEVFFFSPYFITRMDILSFDHG